MTTDEATNCEEKENIVTATKKGAAVLDQWLPDYVKTQYHVLQMASLILYNLYFGNKFIAFSEMLFWAKSCLFFD